MDPQKRKAKTVDQHNVLTVSIKCILFIKPGLDGKQL